MLLTFVLIVISSSFGLAHPTCESYKALELKAKCGSKGYLLHYGYRNCNSFYSPVHYNQFDQVGKKWIDCTGKCLATKARQIVSRTNDCKAIKTAAFDSHVDCYLQCGICKACKTNKNALRKTFDFRDFANAESLKQVVAIAAKCNLKCFI
ncbi:unnamed protein product [Auanema sp. JU1783]|nr:unnamed protein product [Auanema sp. JU1783]